MDTYTIYDRPDDYPQGFVVRRFRQSGGEPVPTADCWCCLTLEEARKVIPLGLACFARDPSDPPSVVETWL